MQLQETQPITIPKRLPRKLKKRLNKKPKFTASEIVVVDGNVRYVPI